MKLLVIVFYISIIACAGVPQPTTPAPAAPPNTLTLTIPNWPTYGYMIDGAIVILTVRDAANFPVPKEFAFPKSDGTVITIPMLQPEEKK